MRADLLQVVKDLTPPESHKITVAGGVSSYWPSLGGFSCRPVLAADGKTVLDRYAQLVGFISNTGADPVVVSYQISPDVLIGGWITVRTHTIAAGGFLEMVEDLTGENVRIQLDSINGTTLIGNVVLYPLSVLESSRAAGAPDVIDLEVKETVHHNAAQVIANGTDALLDGSFSGGRFQVTSNATLVSATVQFSGSINGVNFVPLRCRNEATGAIATETTIAANANEVWVVDTAGLNYLRARISAIDTGVGTGTCTVISKIIEGASPDAAPDVVDLETKETTHQAAANAIGNGTDATLDGAFSAGKIQVTSTAGIVAATVQFFGSVDGVNYVPLECRNTATGALENNTVIGALANEIWEVEVPGLQFLRCRLNAINPAAGVPTVTVISKIIEGANSADLLKSWNENERAKTNPIVGQDGVQGDAGATTANTQRVVLSTTDLLVLATGVNNAVSPTRAILQGLQYNAVPPVGADGDMMPEQGNAYGHREGAEFSRPLGAIQSVDVAPALLARLPVTIRASAALPAAGAEDVPIEIPTGGYGYLVVQGVYTRGAVGGGFHLRVQIADTVGGVDYWVERTLNDSGVFAAGTPAVDGGVPRRYSRYATSANAEGERDVVIQIGGADKVRIYAKEIGVSATPGVLAIYGKFSNQTISEPVAADSKSYTPGTDSKRVENISPDPYVFVDEPLGVNVTNIAANTYYYPSSAGGPMGPYNKITVDFTVSGGVTVTFEISLDGGTTWKDISLYMIDLETGAAGVASWVDTAACLYQVVNAPLWRVKYVTADATNDIEISVRRKY